MVGIRKVALLGTLVLGAGVFAGCDWLGSTPLNGSLGNNAHSDVTLSAFANQVDVTLHNVESNYVMQLGGQCGWHGQASAYCMETTAAKITSTTAVLQAIGDCGLVASIGTICSWGDLYNSAVNFAWGGDGSKVNCLGFHATFGGNFVEPTSPPIGGYDTQAGSWYTIWPFNPYGWNGDGAGIC